MRILRGVAVLIGTIALAFSQAALAQPEWLNEVGAIEIGGVVGLSQPEKSGCIAVWVPMPDSLAIDGLRWYNNDSSSAFPQVLVQSGSDTYPVALTDALPVAEGVFGETLGWSEVAFSAPIASSTDGLYVIFKMPPGLSAVSEGESGGPAVGYTFSDLGYSGWMSADGVDWVKLHPDYGFAASPVFVARDSGMYVKSAVMRSGGSGDESTQSGMAFRTLMRPAYPNPFNPQTTIAFSLKSEGPMSLAVYNIRGELVRNLLAQTMSAGAYEVVWYGRDQNDASVASGVYFARFVASPISMTQRLVLVR